MIAFKHMLMLLLFYSYSCKGQKILEKETNFQKRTQKMLELSEKNGISSVCSVGCKTCATNSDCIECVDIHANVEGNKKCKCQYWGQGFNDEGYCVQCRVPGCLTCAHGTYISFHCARCVDTRAILVDGWCRCHENQIMVEGICRNVDSAIPTLQSSGLCSVIGCSSCTQAGQCQSCLDPSALLIEGHCSCSYQDQSFNAQGLCVQCLAAECTVCQGGQYYSHQCQQCSNPKAKNLNGECIVEQKMLGAAQTSSNCQTLGCSECQQNSLSLCVKCLDSPWATLNSKNQCQCAFSEGYKLNNQGYCQLCFVEGCQSCLMGQSFSCYRCKDQQNTEIIEGRCVCNTEANLNDEGYCQKCSVTGCESCQSGNQHFCNRCNGNYVLSQSGTCSSIVSEKNVEQSEITSQEKQKVSCGESCEECERGECQKCKQHFYLKGSSCLECNVKCKTCQNAHECKIYQEGWGYSQGKIAHCAVSHCSICSQTIYKCQKCKENYLFITPTLCSQVKQTGEGISFTHFKKQYEKNYQNPREEQIRQQIFQKRMEQIEDLAPLLPYQVGSNSLTDRTDKQLEQLRGYEPSEQEESTEPTDEEEEPLLGNPTSLDWTTKNVVTDVRNQGSCGSCWAFACAACAQSTLVLKGEKTNSIDLSEQYFVQCTYRSTCSGTGYVRYVMDESLGGIPEQSTFPYKPYENYPNICSTDNKLHISSAYTSYHGINDAQIIAALQRGPLACTISSTGWSSYRSGIFQCSSQAQINHVVLLVGYTPSYWIIKNSWGKYWGESGYMRITRTRTRNKHCFIGYELFEYEKMICMVDGCLKCSSTNYCSQCHASSTLSAGKCHCPAKHTFSEEKTCVPCEGFGCEDCALYDPSVCLACHPTMLLAQSCACKEIGHKFSNGQGCVLCSSPACTICQAGQDNVCVQCKDPTATIVSGTCTCDYGYHMENGMCTQICQPPFLYHDGECICPEHQLQANNTCHSCTIVECVSCSINSKSELICSECTENYFFINGICQQCSLDNCLQCGVSQQSQPMCTRCSDITFLIDGQCLYCPIPNCIECSQFDTCSKCVAGAPVNGECIVCESDEYLSPDFQCVKCQVSNCLSCESASTCIRCSEEYVVEDGTCSKCEPDEYVHGNQCMRCQIEGCVKCAEATACSQCADGLINNVGFCEQCPAGEFEEDKVCKPCLLNHGCQECTAVHNCTKCVSGMVVVGGFCMDCPVSMYEENGVCLDCEVDNCVRCDGVHNCTECTQETTLYRGICYPCPEGWYIEGDLCQPCVIRNCFMCSSHQNCIECNQGFQVLEGLCDRCSSDEYVSDEGKCTPCPALCLTCISPLTCTSCISGYFLSSGRCQSCTQLASCVQCVSLTVCTRCEVGSILVGGICLGCGTRKYYQNGECLDCMANCQKCQTGESCSSCAEGFHLNATSCVSCPISFFFEEGSCYSCHPSCLSCSSYQACSQCVDNSAVLLGSQKSCQCPTDHIMLQSGYCTPYPHISPETFQVGLLSIQSGLIECPVGCKVCSEQHHCSQCNIGFYLYSGRCYRCELSCFSCSGSRAQDCLSCSYLRYLSGRECFRCNVPGCLSCVKSNYCIGCMERYVMVDGMCQACPDNCVSCSSSAVCSSCQYGFTLTPGGTCLECLSNCSVCLSEDIRVCLACPTGQYIEDGGCSACEERCLVCDASGGCFKCEEGYNLIDADCVAKCQLPCLECSVIEEKQSCSHCLVGYSIEEGACVPDISCNYEKNCQICPFGFVLVDGSCESCQNDCKYCYQSDKQSCLECYSGYFLQEAACLSCQSPCKQCLSASFCLACQDGYYHLQTENKNTGICLQCAYPCVKCQKGPTQCIQCEKGYSLEGRKCLKKDLLVGFSIKINAPIENFLTKIYVFKQFLATFISANFSPSLITLYSLQTGSIKISGVIEGSSESQVLEIYEKVNKGLNKDKSFMGYEVIEFSLEKTVKEQPTKNNDEEEEVDDSSLIIGLVAAIVGALGAMILIGFIYFRSKKQEQTTISSSSKETPSQSIENQISTQAPIRETPP